ncbi:MAG: rhodanese-related sulfurtransferase [Candidatus Poriferisodalaceae bacterium]
MEVPEIDVRTLAERLDEGATLIDVRQLEEWEQVRVPNVPLIPLDQFVDRIAEVLTDGVVHVICKSGGRSGQAVAFLREQGVDAINVTGGTMAWVDAGLPTESGAK